MLSSGLRALHGFDQVHLTTTFWRRQYFFRVLTRWGNWGAEELHLTSGCPVRWRMAFNAQAVYSRACGLIIVIACLPDINAYGIRERGGQHDQRVSWDPCLSQGRILNEHWSLGSPCPLGGDSLHNWELRGQWDCLGWWGSFVFVFKGKSSAGKESTCNAGDPS